MTKARDLANLISTGNIFGDGAIAASEVTGLAPSATVDTTNAGNITHGTFSAARLPAFSGDITSVAGTSALTLSSSGVVAGTYGSSTAVPVVVVDSKGRVTGVSTQSISGSLTFTGDATGSGTTGSTTQLTLANSGVVAGTYTKITVDAKGRATGGTTISASDIPSLDASKITSGVIDAARLPSYVDDVLEYANLASFPGTGESGKIYLALDTNKAYRWSGSAYVYITSGAVDSVAGRTGVVTLTSSDVGLGLVENKNSATIRSEITSTNVTTALGFTPYNSTNPSGYITSSALTPYLLLAGGTSTGQQQFNANIYINGNFGTNVSTTAYNSQIKFDAAYNDVARGPNKIELYNSSWLGGFGIHNNTLAIYSGGVTTFYNSATAYNSVGTTTLSFDSTSISYKGNAVLHAGNYNSYSPTLTGSGASGTWGINISGTAATATNLSTNRTNWSTNGTITAVVGQLAWKNYGNSHTIFDASASTSPDGTAVDRTNANVPWTGSYPTLMGWNGASTYGVRVDSARVADSAGSVDYNNLTNKTGGTGTYTTSGDYRAPIFYDSDNTGYYVDPNNVSNIHRLNVTGYNDSTPNTSFGIQLGGNAGISTWNFNPNGSGSYRNLTFYATGWSGSAVVTRDVLTIGNYGGYVGIRENNPNNFLQIGSVGSSGYSGNHIAIGDGTYAYAEYLNGSSYMAYYTTSGYYYFTGRYLQADGSMRAPIFYDSNDTDYYIDPNSYSRINTIALGSAGSLIGSGNSYPLSIYHGTRYLMGFRNSGSGTSNYPWLVHDNWNGDAVIFHFNGIADRFRFSSGGIGQADSDFRAPIFYDSNDTSYYTDPNSGSRLAHLYVGNVSSSNDGGWNARLNVVGSSHARLDVVSNSDGIITTMYSHTGQGVGRVGTYSNHPLIIMAEGGQVGGSAYNGSLRSPIFYDSNDTSYYIDPNSDSNSALRMRGGALFGPNPTWGAYLYVGTNGWVSGTATVAATNGNLHLDSVGAGYPIYLNNYTGAPVYSRAIYSVANTAYYINPFDTSELNKVYYNSNMVSRNYGIGQVGLYSSYRYQAVFSMGESYLLPADGTTTGNLYGMAWSHPNAGGIASNLNSHGILMLENGGFYGAWGGGSLRTPTDIRAPIFYDYSNTGYYCDPNSGSRLSETFTDNSYTYGWFRNYNTNGLYNQTYGNHWYATSDAYWNIAANNSSNVAILFRTGGHQGTVRGYVYADSSNNIGFLSSAGSWRLRVVGDDYSLADGSSMRAQLYYDSNDTGYYVDPRSASRLSGLRLDGVDNNAAGSDYILWINKPNNNDWAFGITGQLEYNIIYDGASSHSYGVRGLAAGAEYWRVGTDLLYHNSNIRAPIFYDNSDSGYYIDPNSTSQLVNLTLRNLYFRGVGGDSGADQASYGIYQEPGGWNHPYPDLVIGYHTGVKIGGYYGYGGTRFYNNNPASGSLIASVGDGDNAFRSYDNVIAYASDRRLKENIVNISNALNKVLALNGVTFDWKPEVKDLGFEPSSKHEAGVLAQEVRDVLPEAVEIAPFDYDWKKPNKSKSGEEYLTVKYEKLVPLLIEAIKEQQQQIEALKKQVESLL